MDFNAIFFVINKLKDDYELLKVCYVNLVNGFDVLEKSYKKLKLENKLLKEKCNEDADRIRMLEDLLRATREKCNLLWRANTEVNRVKCQIELMCDEYRERCERMKVEMLELDNAHKSNMELGLCKKLLVQVEKELIEQHALVETLSRDKELLVEKNYALMVQVSKFETLVEKMGHVKRELKETKQIFLLIVMIFY